MFRARWARWLDALVGALAIWGVAALAWPTATAQGSGVLAGLALLALAALRHVRAVWRPISGLVALTVSRPLRPGDRAWFVTAQRVEMVIVTGRRGLRVVIANLAEGPAEGFAVRRTRVWLVPADHAATAGR